MFNSNTNLRASRNRRGTSVLSATIALTLVAISVSTTVPEWIRSREQQTACEAIDYLANVHQAQEQYRNVHGEYAADLSLLDLAFVPPANFDVGPLCRSAIHADNDNWSITLTRYAVRTVVGAYSITCDQDGFKRIQSDSATSMAGLQPKIKG
jgi:type II secretory pathway pseudopilin PulG